MEDPFVPVHARPLESFLFQNSLNPGGGLRPEAYRLFPMALLRVSEGGTNRLRQRMKAVRGAGRLE